MRRRAPVPKAEPWHDDRPGLERAYRVDRLGETGPTPGQVVGRFWRPVGHGWYRPVEPPSSVEQRIVEAAYALPSYGGVTGWAELRWRGGRWFTGDDADGVPRPVPLAVHSSHRTHRPGTLLSKDRAQPHEFSTLDGLPLTNAARATLFEMRFAADLREAVTVLDMACFNDLVSLAEVQALADTCSGWTGIPQARAAIPLARENSWSPRESALRLRWELDAAHGPLLCNVPIFDLHGRHLLTPDLLDPVAGVVGEYDGRQHLALASRRRDVRREETMRTVGLEYVEVMAGDTDDELHQRLQHAYARAARAAHSDRGWTVEPPVRWKQTTTVAQRRALSDADRQRLLAHRAA